MEKHFQVGFRRRVWVLEHTTLVGLAEVVGCFPSRSRGGGGRGRRFGNEGFGEYERESVLGLQPPLLVVTTSESDKKKPKFERKGGD